MSRPKTTGLLLPALLVTVAAGETVKGAAYNLGLCHRAAYKLLNAAGWRAVYLSAAEHELIERKRARGIEA